jgi:transcription antitermination factor NusG
METGKTGKYFKYAIGEIILVVIGILIALQVSNWNKQNDYRKLEKRYLSELILDLQKDSVFISETRVRSKKQMESKNKLTRYFEGYLFIEDSLRIYFNEQWKPVSKFNPITTTVDEMKSTGNIGVIQNSDIRRNILETYNYYTTHINNTEERYYIQQNALGNLVVSKVPNIFVEFYETTENFDIISVLNDYEIKNHFLGNYANGFNEALNNLQSENEKLLTVLRKESLK